MKATSLVITLFLLHTVAAFACPVCEKQQPKLLRGITHGAGPQSNWDYLIVWAAVLIVLFTLFYTVKWMIRPEEKNSDHIKRMVLNG
jgi:uncharacterized protein HemY